MGKKQQQKKAHKAAEEAAAEGKGADKRKGSAKQQVRPADRRPTARCLQQRLTL